MIVIMLPIPMPRYRPTLCSPAIARASPARAASTAASTVSAAARLGDPVGPGEGLEATVVPAVARWAIGVDDLVADLAGRAVVAQVDVTVDGDDATDPGTEGQPDHRIGSARGAEP